MYLLSKELLEFWIENKIPINIKKTFLKNVGFEISNWLFDVNCAHIWNDDKTTAKITSWNSVYQDKCDQITKSQFTYWCKINKHFEYCPYHIDPELIDLWNRHNVSVKERQDFLIAADFKINLCNSYGDKIGFYYWNTHISSSRYTASKSLEEGSIPITVEQYRNWLYPKKQENDIKYHINQELIQYWNNNKILKPIRKAFLSSIGVNPDGWNFDSNKFTYFWTNPKKIATTLNVDTTKSKAIDILSFLTWYEGKQLINVCYISFALFDYWIDKKIPLETKQMFLKHLGLNPGKYNWEDKNRIYYWNPEVHCDIKDIVKPFDFFPITIEDFEKWYDPTIEHLAEQLSNMIINELKPGIIPSKITQETITIKQNNYVNRLQKQKASISGGIVPEGHRIKGRTSKTSTGVGHLSYTAVKG